MLPNVRRGRNHPWLRTIDLGLTKLMEHRTLSCGLLGNITPTLSGAAELILPLTSWRCKQEPHSHRLIITVTAANVYENLLGARPRAMHHTGKDAGITWRVPTGFLKSPWTSARSKGPAPVRHTLRILVITDLETVPVLGAGASKMKRILHQGPQSGWKVQTLIRTGSRAPGLPPCLLTCLSPPREDLAHLTIPTAVTGLPP